MTDSLQPVEPGDFKQAMSRFTSGVTVVTTETNGRKHGITVSAFSSLSLDPPLVLICIDKSAGAHDAISDAKKFVVNVLAESQEDVSNRFASRADDKYDGMSWHAGRLGLPVLDGSLAAVECDLHDSLPGGDHTIFVGRVVNTEVTDGSPLLYGQGAYRRVKS